MFTWIVSDTQQYLKTFNSANNLLLINKIILIRKWNHLTVCKKRAQVHLKMLSTKCFIFMLCHQHGYPWLSLATSPYRSTPLAGLQGYISYSHIAAVCMFELVVLLLLGHMWGSIGVHHLWARPCFSSSVLHVWFV